jgi:DNA polymerase III delta subunit
VAAFPKFCVDHRLVLSASALPASHALRKIKNERFALVELSDLRGFELRRWAERELKREGFARWDEETIDLLCLTAEESADQVASMIKQLALYTDSPNLSMNDIAQLFVQRVVPGEFDFLDALANRNHGKCELMITDLLRSGKNPFMLLSLIARSFSNYLAIATMRAEGVSPATIRQELGMAPWVYNKAEAILRRHSPDSLASAIHTLVRVDSRLKNRSLGVDLLMSELIDGITHATRRPLPMGASHS